MRCASGSIVKINELPEEELNMCREPNCRQDRVQVRPKNPYSTPKHAAEDHRGHPFPDPGTSAIPLDPSLSAIRAAVGSGEELSCYIVESIKDDDGRYRQEGCSPNWQGGVITLCACKHKMRAGRSAE